MFAFSLISYLLIALMLMNMMAKVRPWTRKAAPGKAFKILPMGLISRIWLHRFSLMALLTGILFGVTTGWLPSNTAGMISAFALIIIFLPMRYSLTTKGVAVGDGIFYPWSDFSGYTAKRLGLELDHSSYFGRLTLFIKPAEMDSVLEYVERHVKNRTTNS
jgi:hypothetical protein